MTGALAGLAMAVSSYIYLAWLLRAAQPGRKIGVYPPKGSLPAAASALPPAPPLNAHANAPGWLPATLPVPPADRPPWQPRVCAGRVAPLELTDGAAAALVRMLDAEADAAFELPRDLRGTPWSPSGWTPPASWRGTGRQAA